MFFRISKNKKSHPKGYLFRCGRSDRSRPSASHTVRLATQILTNFGTRQPLFAKNNPPDCFLNAQTFSGSTLLPIKQKIAVSTNVETAILVGVTGVEPAASTSQMWRATSCATPRTVHFFVSLDSIYYFMLFVNIIFKLFFTILQISFLLCNIVMLLCDIQY